MSMKTNLLITNRSWLSTASTELKKNGIRSSQLDALILLSYVTSSSKAEIFANPNKVISEPMHKRLCELLKLRAVSHPMAYITKEIEFYGRTFFVDKRTLVPRPESESFINILKLSKLDGIHYLTDLGCGSGNLGITIKLEFPSLQIELLDNYKGALEVAKINLNKYKISSEPIKSNFLSNSNKKYDIIVANLPYIPIDMPINSSAKFEPKNAIYSGEDGLHHYRLLAHQIKEIGTYPKYLLIECLQVQLEDVAKIFSSIGYSLSRSENLVHQLVR